MRKEKLLEFKIEVEKLIKKDWGFEGVTGVLKKLDNIYDKLNDTFRDI